MITILLSVATSTLFGVADFFGGFASRRDSAVLVTANSHVIGLVLFSLALVAFPVPYDRTAVLAGISGGVFGGIGVVALYAALARGRMSLVAPITAALSGSLPAVYDLARGTQISPTAVAGLVLALAATIIVSASPAHEDDGHPTKMSRAALGLSLLAGLGFSGSFISFSFAGADSGFWPLAAARLTSVVMLGTIAVAQQRRLFVRPDARPMTLGAGFLDAAANVTILAAIRIGPLAIASVLGSLYPLVTVLLARIVLGERLRWMQRVGIAMAIVAVVLAAWPT